MLKDERKAAAAAYKERKSAAGVFAIRCAAADASWVGRSLSLDTVQNRHWFALKVGSHASASLQQAWRDHGAEALTFQMLERLSDEQLSHGRDALLKERVTHWRAALNAESI